MANFPPGCLVDCFVFFKHASMIYTGCVKSKNVAPGKPKAGWVKLETSPGTAEKIHWVGFHWICYRRVYCRIQTHGNKVSCQIATAIKFVTFIRFLMHSSISKSCSFNFEPLFCVVFSVTSVRHLLLLRT